MSDLTLLAIHIFSFSLSLPSSLPLSLSLCSIPVSIPVPLYLYPIFSSPYAPARNDDGAALARTSGTIHLKSPALDQDQPIYRS